MSNIEGVNFYSEDISKMFPVSFERPHKYDRALSEENLVDWFRGVTSDSCDPVRNSRFSYVITRQLNEAFAQNDRRPTQDFEFMIGGYYVKVSDRGFARMGSLTNKDIYAVISETSSQEEFRHLTYGEAINNNGDILKAIRFVTVPHNEQLLLTSPAEYKLHILRVDDRDRFEIPPQSRRATFAVDGGEID